MQHANNLLNKTFKNKRIVITGHTGFKDSQLAIWLDSLGFKIYEISFDIPSIPSNFITSDISLVVNCKFNIKNYFKFRSFNQLSY